jgi:hypothetical protein
MGVCHTYADLLLDLYTLPTLIKTWLERGILANQGLIGRSQYVYVTSESRSFRPVCVPK